MHKMGDTMATENNLQKQQQQGHDNRSTYQHYPQLTAEEFAEACHLLDSRYCRATLGPARQQWRLHLHTALDVSSSSLSVASSGFITFLQIARPLDDGGFAAGDELASQLSKFRLDAGADEVGMTDADAMMVSMEDADKHVVPKQQQQQEEPPFRPGRFTGGQSYVSYEVHLHPTYRAPCLWFTLHNLPPNEPALDIETVFRRLVPDQFKEALRSPSGIGGISADHHPVTGVPSFFVHPCMLGDAMAHFDCPKEDYLMVWLGLVGGPVGLWVPQEIAMA